MTKKHLHVDEPLTEGDPPEGSPEDIEAHPWKVDDEAEWQAFGERVRKVARPGETREQALRRILTEAVRSDEALFIRLGWND